MALAIAAVGAEYAFLLFVLRLEAVVTELSSTAPALLWATAALGLALFLLYDLCLDSAAIGLDNCVEVIKKVIELKFGVKCLQ